MGSPGMSALPAGVAQVAAAPLSGEQHVVRQGVRRLVDLALALPASERLSGPQSAGSVRLRLRHHAASASHRAEWVQGRLRCRGCRWSVGPSVTGDALVDEAAWFAHLEMQGAALHVARAGVAEVSVEEAARALLGLLDQWAASFGELVQTAAAVASPRHVCELG